MFLFSFDWRDDMFSSSSLIADGYLLFDYTTVYSTFFTNAHPDSMMTS